MLRPARRPLPTPGPGEVLVRVAAAGVNRPDVLQRQGKYAPPPGASDIPGLEIAGHVVGDGASLRDGDAVCALLPGGGYAEYAVAAEPLCLPVPRGFSMEEAAALPETFFTVWHNVFERGRLAAGETLLVHGGSSGIGTTAILLARAFGARVLVDRGHAGEVRGVCRAGGRAGDRLQAGGLRRGRRRVTRAAAASTSCWTWSARPTSSGTSPASRPRAGWSRSRSRAGPRPS